MRQKPYVGVNGATPYVVFRSGTVPTESTHGHLYGAVIGPFRTMRGARYMAACGPGGQLGHVDVAERRAKEITDNTKGR
jgi:hypothetical protein